MEDSRTLAVVQVAFAVKPARIAVDRELHFLLAGLGDIQSNERPDWPRRVVTGGMAMLVMDEGELELARLLGMMNRPAAAEAFRGARCKAHEEGTNQQNIGDQSVTSIHGVPPCFISQRPARRSFSIGSICRA